MKDKTARRWVARNKWKIASGRACWDKKFEKRLRLFRTWLWLRRKQELS